MNNQEAEMAIGEIIELQKEQKRIEEKIQQMKDSLKLFFKQNGLDKFGDSFGNVATLRIQTRDTFDKNETLRLLGETAFKESVKFKSSTFEVFTVLSKESAEKMKTFVESKQ